MDEQRKTTRQTRHRWLRSGAKNPHTQAGGGNCGACGGTVREEVDSRRILQKSPVATNRSGAFLFSPTVPYVLKT